MRKFLPVATILLTVALLFAGCRTMEDMIPKQLGEPEGLWLYRGAERMRTDGSEKEPLFDEVELDGEIYTAENYTVKMCHYFTDAKTVFFIIAVGEDRWSHDTYHAYLYCYDYAEKSGKQVSGPCNWVSFSSSKDYCLLESWGHDRETVTSLFLHDGTPVCENKAEFDLSEDILWRYEYGERGNVQFTWWKAGEIHSVETEMNSYITGNDFYDGEYFYEFSGQGFSVNTDTGETDVLGYEGTKSEWRVFHGTAYFLTYENEELCTNKYHSVTHDRYIYSSCRLYACIDGKAKLLYTFDESLDITFRGYGDYEEGFVPLAHRYGVVQPGSVYTQVNGRWEKEPPSETTEYRAYYFDTTKGELRKGEAPTIPQGRKELVCGDYTFWVNYQTYGWGHRCYYFYRKHGDTVEIMQYAFDDKYSGKFYDDICAF